jgi:hypothetical protein
MFGRTTKSTAPNYDPVIDKLLDELNEYGPDTEEFKAAMGYLEKIHKFQGRNAKIRFDPNTILQVGGGLAGILIMVGYERMHVITSKALGHLIKSN